MEKSAKSENFFLANKWNSASVWFTFISVCENSLHHCLRDFPSSLIVGFPCVTACCWQRTVRGHWVSLESRQEHDSNVTTFYRNSTSSSTSATCNHSFIDSLARVLASTAGNFCLGKSQKYYMLFTAAQAVNHCDTGWGVTNYFRIFLSGLDRSLDSSPGQLCPAGQ